MSQFTLSDLEKRVQERAKASATESYTRALIDFSRPTKSGTTSWGLTLIAWTALPPARIRR